MCIRDSSSTAAVPYSCGHCWRGNDLGIFTFNGDVLANRFLLADAAVVIVLARDRILSFSDSNQGPHDELEAEPQIAGSKIAREGITCDSA